MSVPPLIADASLRCRNMAHWARSCLAQAQTLLDHLVGDGKHARRDIKAKYFCDPEIDNELRSGGLDYRQVGRLCALQNPSHIDAALTKILAVIGAIAHQPSRLRKLAAIVNRRDCVPGSQCKDLITSVHEKSVDTDDQPADA